MKYSPADACQLLKPAKSENLRVTKARARGGEAGRQRQEQILLHDYIGQTGRESDDVINGDVEPSRSLIHVHLAL